jgi:hypothetical protein
MSVMGKGIFLYMTESAGDCIIPGEFSFVEKLLPSATPFTVIGFPKHQMSFWEILPEHSVDMLRLY